MNENADSESTKKTLIVTVGVVAVVAVIAFAGWKIYEQQGYRVTCKDGSTETRINPEDFVLKYAGKKITADTEWKDKIKQSFSIEDKVLQQAIDATQLLDQRLRFVIVEYNASLCDAEGKVLLRKLNKLKSDDLVKLAAIQKELNEIALKKDTSRESRVKELIKQKNAATEKANTQLGSK